MYSKQSELRDKTTDVVDFFNGKFQYLGIEFQIYSDKRNPKTPDLALKRNDTKPPKRISGLFSDNNVLNGDTRNGQVKRYFQLALSPEKESIILYGFKEALEVLGIETPVEQNNLFTEPLRALKDVMGVSIATGRAESDIQPDKDSNRVHS